MIATLALVPARGGSKGIPRKNVVTVAGRPLIAWTIDQARNAKRVERVLVTTDDPEIAAVSRAAGAEVPFLRPAALAADDTPGIAPVLHALEWLEEHEGGAPDVVVLLQPTSPLRTAADIDAALGILDREGADAVVSITRAEHHPAWMRQVAPDGRLVPFAAGPTPARRQDLRQAYVLNGAIYAARTEALRRTHGWDGERTFAYVMPRERSLDVDEPFDLEIAGFLLEGRYAR